MLISFLKLDDRPTSLLIPNICWSRYKITSMARLMAESSISVAYSLQANRTEYFLQHIIVLVDLECPNSDEFLLKASEENYLKSPYRWLLLAPDNSSRKNEVLDNMEILVDSDVVVASKTNEEFIFTEVYKISKDSEIIYTTRAIWRSINYKNNSTYLNDVNFAISESSRKNVGQKTVVDDKYGVIEDYRRSTSLSIRRKDLKGHILTVSNVVIDNNQTKEHMNDRLFLDQDLVTKVSYAIVKICFQSLNATEKLLFTSTWGYKDKNGSYNGIMEHLIKKRADLGTMAFFNQERLVIIDYIAMVGSTGVRFVFREPPLAYISNIFTLPFTRDVWLAIFICVLGCALFLYITSKWEATMTTHQYQLDGSWADVLILIIGAVLQQGCTLEPRYAPGRTVTLLLFVALTILYAAYSANIVVLLRAPSSSVRSLSDLLNSPLKVGASDVVYNKHYMKQLKDPIRKGIYDTKFAPKGKNPNYYDMKDGVEKIRQGLFAFHMELNPGYRLIQKTYQENEKCDLVEIDYINEVDPWLPGQKRSPFKDLFKINFLKIRETGIQANSHHRLTVPRPRCSGSVATFSSVGITDMYPALLATLYGMMMAPAVLLLEIAYYKLMKIRQRRQRRQHKSIKSKKKHPDFESVATSAGMSVQEDQLLCTTRLRRYK
ncbi:ionotropic receptor 75a-like [Achroia grisella]|uniref:ionotropic receptor 75a-like n=1 Tax=Achroia grisella TaxID=688607 RepID=UPI0027D2930D|nr:ionotropic receptor 75a-like [Achroia grisella]